MKRVIGADGKDKGSRLEHLQAVAKQIGRNPPELNFVPPSDDISYILRHYYLIKTRRGELLTFRELQAYSEMTRANLAGWEVETLADIDRIFEAALNG